MTQYKTLNKTQISIFYIVLTKGDGAPLPHARLYGDGGSVEYSFFVVIGPAVTGLFNIPELERGKILFCL